MDRIEVYETELRTLTARAETLLNEGKVSDASALMPRVKELRTMVKAEADMAEVRKAMELVPVLPENRSSSEGWGEVRKAMLEKRAISSNGAGVNTVSDVITALVDGGKLRSKVAVFTAPTAKSIVPTFAPSLALPVGQAPGATGVAADSTAVLAGKELALKSWMSILAVNMDALVSTSIEAKLPGIFAESFAGAIDKGILVGTGSGSDMLGVFVASASGVTTTQDIACAASGAPKWVDLIKLAGQIIGIGGDLSKAAIVMHPDLIANLLSEATTSTEALKTELLTKGTIRSIPVIESSYCPTTLTAGSYVAVGGHFNHYGLAIARELTIDPVKTVGYDGTTFQAFCYMQGAPIVATSFRRLKTV